MKRLPNIFQNFERVLSKEYLISISSEQYKKFIFNQNFLYTWSKPFQNFFGDNFLFPAQNASSLAVQLYHVYIQYFYFFNVTITTFFFQRSFFIFCMHWSGHFTNQGFSYMFLRTTSSFWGFIVLCFSLFY